MIATAASRTARHLDGITVSAILQRSAAAAALKRARGKFERIAAACAELEIVLDSRLFTCVIDRASIGDTDVY